MKSVRTIVLTTQLAALLLCHALPAEVEVTKPFDGTFHGAETGAVDFPTLYLTGEVAGNASHLGRFTLLYDLVADLLTISSSGTAQLIAANGDHLFAEVIGQATVVEPDLYSVVELYTITDGTGRFEGADGSFVLTRRLVVSTGVTSGSFCGTLVLNQAK